MLRKANWDKTLQKSLKFSDCRKSIRKLIRPSCGKNLSTSFCACLVSFCFHSEIRANIRKLCRRPVVTLLYATKSALTAPNMLGRRTCLPCHIPDRWSRNANRIWPDLAFGFVHKRSGNEISSMQMSYSYASDLPFKNFCKLAKQAETIKNRFWLWLSIVWETRKLTLYQPGVF